MTDNVDKPAEKAAFQNAVEKITEVAGQAENALNEAISVTARGVVQAASAVHATSESALESAQNVADVAKAHAQRGLSHYQVYEDRVFAALRHGIEWGAENPYVAYGAATSGAVLLLPVTRRLLWRVTFGRFRTPESVVRSAEHKVGALKPQVDDFAKQAIKLQERMAVAEQEYTSGLSKLRATRQELQRLSSVVQRTERTAHSTLQELRSVRKDDTSVALRGEAAALLATLKSQRAELERSVYRIVAKDI